MVVMVDDFEKVHANSFSENTKRTHLTLPLLCNIVVRVLHCLSRLTMSRVKSTSASTKLRCSAAFASNGSSPLIVVLLRAMILARIAAILAIGIACDKDELKQTNHIIIVNW